MRPDGQDFEWQFGGSAHAVTDDAWVTCCSLERLSATGIDQKGFTLTRKGVELSAFQRDAVHFMKRIGEERYSRGIGAAQGICGSYSKASDR